MLPALRKGIPCHQEILNSYLRGVDWKDGDIVIFADCLANRHHGLVVWVRTVFAFSALYLQKGGTSISANNNGKNYQLKLAGPQTWFELWQPHVRQD